MPIMFQDGNTDSADASLANSVWNIASQAKEYFGDRKLQDIRSMCEDANISFTEYLWSPMFDVETAEEIENRLRAEWNAERDAQQAESANSFYQQQERKREREEEESQMPKFGEMSMYFRIKLFQFVKRIDPKQKFEGWPSISAERANKNEYSEGEILIGRAAQQVIKNPPRKLVFKFDQPSSTENLNPPPEPQTTATSLGVKPTFPDPKSEQIYNFVEQVITFYQERRNQYATDTVFKALNAYRTKITTVKVGFSENAMKILDCYDDSERVVMQTDLNDACTLFYHFLGSFVKEWNSCGQKLVFLVDVKEKMVEGCYGFFLLKKAKLWGKLMVANMKRAHLSLYKCMDAVRDVYGLLLDINDQLMTNN